MWVTSNTFDNDISIYYLCTHMDTTVNKKRHTKDIVIWNDKPMSSNVVSIQKCDGYTLYVINNNIHQVYYN